jgi:2-oxo-3-hexenedioate decarboxylase/2-keto-4-pentenoate hydratase
LAESRLRRQRLDRLPAELEPADEEAGYALAEGCHELLAAAGLGGLVGHKIGCTTDVMQCLLGIGAPCSGRIFERTVQHRAGDVALHDRVTLGVECEIVVWLGADLPCPTGACSPTEAASAVAAAGAAIEVVEDRYADFTSIGAPTLIADDFFNAGCVLGDRNENADPYDLRSVVGTMSVDGIEIGRGSGSDVLGDPLNALCWLAGARARRGLPLQAGEFVLLGSLVQTAWISSPSHISIDLDRLGGATLTVH